MTKLQLKIIYIPLFLDLYAKATFTKQSRLSMIYIPLFLDLYCVAPVVVWWVVTIYIPLFLDLYFPTCDLPNASIVDLHSTIFRFVQFTKFNWFKQKKEFTFHYF